MRLRLLAPLALLLACRLAAASGLQVAPITLTLQPSQSADGLWLSNTAGNTVQAQVRVFRWTQEGGQDRLTPSRDLVVSPPMLQVEPAARQLIRVIRSRAPTGPTEQAYRVIVDELPVKQEGQKGIQFVLSYSIPIFLAPPQPADASASAPALDWALAREGDQTVLRVSNSGAAHAQLSDVVFVDGAGQRVELHRGLLGYVLPGAQMRWPLTLKSPPNALDAGGTLEATINGQASQQRIPPSARPR